MLCPYLNPEEEVCCLSEESCPCIQASGQVGASDVERCSEFTLEEITEEEQA